VDQSARFWDKIAERYSKRPMADEAAYQKKLKVCLTDTGFDIDYCWLPGKGQAVFIAAKKAAVRGVPGA